MKKKETLRRLSGAVSAIAVMLGTIMPSAAEAFPQEYDHSQDEQVRVIVRLKGDPILASCSTELDSDAAKSRAQELRNERMQVFSQLQDICPEAEMELKFDTVFNGFASTVPEGLTDMIRNIPDVYSVTVSEVTYTPELSDALENTGTSEFMNSTGIRGEGQVIAVIDTELDCTHEMFAPLDENISTAISYDDVAEIINSGGLSRDLDPEKVYYSSKIPFAACYVENEDPYDVSDKDEKSSYHGTHVSGIAAGNTVTYDGKVLSGFAPDAQLIFFGVGSRENKGTMDEAAILAGLEDSVKLGADVINMSFSRHGQAPIYDTVVEEVLKIIDDAGIVVCCSAGNEKQINTQNNFRSPDDPDLSTVGTPGIFPSVISAAAGQSVQRLNMQLSLPDGTVISYREDSNELLEGEYEYFYCGKAAEVDITELDLKGKLALVDMADCDDVDMTDSRAKTAGAVGVIMFDSNIDTILNTEDTFYYSFLSHTKHGLLISTQDAQLLIDNPDKRVDLDAPDTYYAYNRLYPFSSMGIPQNFEFKPEITGIGGMYSAKRGGGYSFQNGTSMASPCIAGCAALTNALLDSRGTDISGSDRTKLIKNILMNSAVPIVDDGLRISPRMQGAGMVNITAMENTKVIMTGSSGKAAVVLGELNDNTFSFDVTIKNISDQDVAFNTADASFTTDKAEYDYTFNREQLLTRPEELKTSVTLPEDMLTISAGDEKTVTVTVAVDEENAAAKDAEFRNGWFIDGFLTLSGADNCCDISIPVVGFHGDWYSMRTLWDDVNTAPENGLKTYAGSDIAFYPYCVSMSLSQMICAQLMSYDTNTSKDDYKSMYAQALNHEYCLSPNGDHISDTLHYFMCPLRDANVSDVTITDKDGRTVLCYKGSRSIINDDYEEMVCLADIPLEDGSYHASFSTYLFAENSEERKQPHSFDFTVDTVDPKISDVKITERNGRKILSFKASDERLEGFYVIGKGKGSLPGKENNNSAHLIHSALKDLYKSFLQKGRYFQSKTDREVKYENDLIEYILSVIKDDNNSPENDLIDAIPATPDENGTQVFEYDVTDLNDFSVTVADAGMNTAVYSPDRPLVHEIPDSVTLKIGDKLMPAETPETDGKTTAQGWQIMHCGSGEWTELKSTDRVKPAMNGSFIRYYAEYNGERGYSNRMRVTVSNACRMNMDLYVNDSIECSTTITACHKDFEYYYANYALRIELTADGYVPRTISFSKTENKSTDLYLCMLGDLNGDGAVNVTDISKAAAHLKGIKSLNSYEQKVADVKADGRLNVTDISKIAAKVKGISNF